MSNKKNLYPLLVLLISVLFGLGVTMLWSTKSSVDIYSDTLGTGHTGATSALDSMSCFPWHPRFTITAGPGYNDTSCFSRGRANTGYGDSILQTIVIRGWTNATRTQLIFEQNLWATGAFTQFSRPMGNFWAGLSKTKQDSMNRNLIATKHSFLKAGLVQHDDSTSFYYGDGRGYNYQLIPFAPYYDIVMADSAAKTGKDCRVKISVFGFKEE